MKLSPLFMEQMSDGNWKVSLGRVAFWITLAAYLAMCLAVAYTFVWGVEVSADIGTLYLSVITMLFLTVLGLLGYNLGSKFTEPMKKMIETWRNHSSS